MKEQIWKEVSGFEGLYQVNQLGVVRSLDRQVYHPGNNSYHHIHGKILSTRINNWEYYSVRLSKGGRTYTRFPHRLMAEAFIPNPLNKGYVNHKNAIKTCNTLENLEWVTHSENIQHAYSMKLIKKKTKRNTVKENLFYIPKKFRSRRIKNDKDKV